MGNCFTMNLGFVSIKYGKTQKCGNYCHEAKTCEVLCSQIPRRWRQDMNARLRGEAQERVRRE